jgi:hypothetical protein
MWSGCKGSETVVQEYVNPAPWIRRERNAYRQASLSEILKSRPQADLAHP